MEISYGYRCEYCDGTVQTRRVAREAFRHRDGIVILEDAPVGVCDTCGDRYYHASLLRRVDDIVAGVAAPDRIEPVPVGHIG